MPILGMTLVQHVQKRFDKTRTTLAHHFLGKIPWTKGVTHDLDLSSAAELEMIGDRAKRAVPMILHSSSLALSMVPYINTLAILPWIRSIKQGLTTAPSLGSIFNLTLKLGGGVGLTLLFHQGPKYLLSATKEGDLAFNEMLKVPWVQNFAVFPARMFGFAITGDAMVRVFFEWPLR
jgi:hypothetical protein